MFVSLVPMMLESGMPATTRSRCQASGAEATAQTLRKPSFIPHHLVTANTHHPVKVVSCCIVKTANQLFRPNVSSTCLKSLLGARDAVALEHEAR